MPLRPAVTARRVAPLAALRLAGQQRCPGGPARGQLCAERSARCALPLCTPHHLPRSCPCAMYWGFKVTPGVARCTLQLPTAPWTLMVGRPRPGWVQDCRSGAPPGPPPARCGPKEAASIGDTLPPGRHAFSMAAPTRMRPSVRFGLGGRWRRSLHRAAPRRRGLPETCEGFGRACLGTTARRASRQAPQSHGATSEHGPRPVAWARTSAARCVSVSSCLLVTADVSTSLWSVPGLGWLPGTGISGALRVRVSSWCRVTAGMASRSSVRRPCCMRRATCRRPSRCEAGSGRGLLRMFRHAADRAASACRAVGSPVLSVAVRPAASPHSVQRQLLECSFARGAAMGGWLVPPSAGLVPSVRLPMCMPTCCSGHGLLGCWRVRVARPFADMLGPFAWGALALAVALRRGRPARSRHRSLVLPLIAFTRSWGRWTARPDR